MNRKAFAALMAMVILGTLAVAGTSAEAKKPAPSPTGNSISLVQNPVKLGDWVNFNYSYTGNVSSPRIEVDCYQNGAMVFAAAGPAGDAVLLGGAGSVWLTNGGAANCTATLYYWDFHPNQTFVPLASTSFNTN